MKNYKLICASAMLSLSMLSAGNVMAQMPNFGFGGNQQSQKQAEYSEKFTDINYADDDSTYHTLDVYLPKSPMPRSGYPVIVHIYGSAWFSNSSKGMADINTICAALLDAGYAVVCPNHRSSMNAKYPAQINDIKAVIRWVRGNAVQYKFDTNFVGTSGFSSGAHLASLCAATNDIKIAKKGNTEMDIEGNIGKYTHQSSYVNACCEWSGPIDLMNMDCDGVKKQHPAPEDMLMGFEYAGHEDAYSLLSPAYFVNANTVPIRVCHGEKDNVVPFCQGQSFYKTLVDASVKGCSFVAEPEGGHGFNMYNDANLAAMVEHFNNVRYGLPTEPCSKVVEDGGTGAYKAVMESVDGLKAHTIFRPQDLSAFGKKNLLPVLVWGNGACTNSPWEHFKFLNEIASQGYLVIATGYIPMEEKSFHGPMSKAEQQIESIDWAIAQNEDPNSPLYGKIDTKAIAIAGMSCGGLQTLFNCADPRIKTYMICNSGLFIDANAAIPGMPMPGKAQLESLHGPIFYMLGGEEDIAYRNGMDDFHRINHVPAFAANYPVGHGGTYRQPHGGEFSIPAIAWLNWQLKGDKQAAKMFKGNKCGLSLRDKWVIEKNSLIDKQK